MVKLSNQQFINMPSNNNALFKLLVELVLFNECIQRTDQRMMQSIFFPIQYALHTLAWLINFVLLPLPLKCISRWKWKELETVWIVIQFFYFYINERLSSNTPSQCMNQMEVETPNKNWCKQFRQMHLVFCFQNLLNYEIW